jgi:hypothetical protein
MESEHDLDPGADALGRASPSTTSSPHPLLDDEGVSPESDDSNLGFVDFGLDSVNGTAIVGKTNTNTLNLEQPPQPSPKSVGSFEAGDDDLYLGSAEAMAGAAGAETGEHRVSDPAEQAQQADTSDGQESQVKRELDIIRKSELDMPADIEDQEKGKSKEKQGFGRIAIQRLPREIILQ